MTDLDGIRRTTEVEEHDTPRKRRRTHAVRSCLACRKRKARCVLPDTTVGSSREALQESLGCARCKSLAIDCVVWDGDRKSKRYTAERAASTGNGKLDDDQAIKESPQDQVLAPFYTHDPSFRAVPHQDTEGGHQVPVTSTQNSGNAIGDEVRREVSSIMNGEYPLTKKMEYINTRLRPLRTLMLLLQRQGTYKCGLPIEFDRIYAEASPSASLAKLLSRIDASLTKDSDLGILAFHCHLPRLAQAIHRYRCSPSISTALLLCAMTYLCKIFTKPQDVNMLLYLTRYYARQVHLRAPRLIEAAQGLELIAVHLPFLLRDDSAEQHGRSLQVDEDCPPAGANLLDVALTLMKSLPEEWVSDEQREQRMCISASLCAWHLAIRLYEPHTGDDNLFDNSAWIDQKKSSLTVEESEEAKIRHAGHAALRARLRILLEAHSCGKRIAALGRDKEINDDLYKASQLSMMADHLEVQKDERALRTVAADDYRRNFCLTGHSAACVDALFLWTDLEAMGFHQKALANSIGATYVRFIERVKQRADSRNETFCPGFSQLWQDPEWAEHINVLGVRRNDEISILLAQANKFRRGTTSDHVAFWPTIPVCATLLMAAKTMLDAQSFVLHHLCRVDKETDSYIVILRGIADMLRDSSLDIDMPKTSNGQREAGIAKCTAEIMRIAADTMSDWQDRQALVLARHRLAEKKKREDRAHSAMQMTPSSAASVDQLSDCYSSLDPLFQGLLEMPILEDFFQQHFGVSGQYVTPTT